MAAKHGYASLSHRCDVHHLPGAIEPVAELQRAPVVDVMDIHPTLPPVSAGRLDRAHLQYLCRRIGVLLSLLFKIFACNDFDLRRHVCINIHMRTAKRAINQKKQTYLLKHCIGFQ